MKKVLILIFTLFFLKVTGQKVVVEKIFMPDSLIGESRKYYMEGKEIDFNKTIIDFGNIENMKSYFGKSAEIHSGTKAAVLITRKNKIPLLTLKEFVEKIKSENQSIKSKENINVVIDDVLIEEISEYKIEESCIKKVTILTKHPKDVNRDASKPSIVIITNRKKITATNSHLAQ